MKNKTSVVGLMIRHASVFTFLFFAAVLMLFATVVIGCAAKVPDYDERLSKPDAPASLETAQIFMEQISYGELQKEIQTINMLHEFKEGRSVYRAFELPDFVQPYTITLRSLVYKKDGKARIFYPVIDLLDEKYKTTTQISLPHLDTTHAITQYNYISLEIPVKAGDEFFVVHTLPSLYDKESVSGDPGSPRYARAGTFDVVMPLRGEYSDSKP